MDSLFKKYWWVYLLRGIIAVIFGLLAIFMPIAAFTGLVIYVGAYMFIDGIFTVIAAISERKTYRNWIWLLISGLIRILIGVLTFINPFATGTALVYLVAFWGLLMGVAEVIWAFRMRHVIKGEGWYIISGILSILFSLLVFFYPAIGAITLALMFGIFIFIIGILFISLSLRLKRHHSRVIPVR
jgi:uncharacterized membrane protein HdeD (DUF308 family)